ncbi:MAG: hypothetical protein HY078_13240 [Elusimicrobia bacterium]|nr:hypothetical protein [Elusimicrobiota bacterium]
MHRCILSLAVAVVAASAARAELGKAFDAGREIGSVIHVQLGERTQAEQLDIHARLAIAARLDQIKANLIQTHKLEPWQIEKMVASVPPGSTEFMIEYPTYSKSGKPSYTLKTDAFFDCSKVYTETSTETKQKYVVAGDLITGNYRRELSDAGEPAEVVRDVSSMSGPHGSKCAPSYTRF